MKADVRLSMRITEINHQSSLFLPLRHERIIIVIINSSTIPIIDILNLLVPIHYSLLVDGHYCLYHHSGLQQPTAAAAPRWIRPRSTNRKSQAPLLLSQQPIVGHSR
jgi:hypothetical protein